MNTHQCKVIENLYLEMYDGTFEYTTKCKRLLPPNNRKGVIGLN